MAEADKKKPDTKPAESKPAGKTPAAHTRALFQAASAVLLDGVLSAAGDDLVLTPARHAELHAAGVVAEAWDDGVPVLEAE